MNEERLVFDLVFVVFSKGSKSREVVYLNLKNSKKNMFLLTIKNVKRRETTRQRESSKADIMNASQRIV